MIHININSWHYRFLEKMEFTPKENLCPYMRQLFYASMLLILMTSCALLLSSFVLFTVGSFLGWFVACIVTLSFIEPREEVIIGAAITIIPSLIWSGVNIGEFFRNYRIEAEYRKELAIEEGTHEPNLLWEYIVALHDKVCPRINFVD